MYFICPNKFIFSIYKKSLTLIINYNVYTIILTYFNLYMKIKLLKITSVSYWIVIQLVFVLIFFINFHSKYYFISNFMQRNLTCFKIHKIIIFQNGKLLCLKVILFFKKIFKRLILEFDTQIIKITKTLIKP